MATAASAAALAGAAALAVQQFGAWALAAVPAILGAVLLLENPVFGVYLMAAALPLEALLSLEGKLPTMKLLGAAVAGAWLLHRLIARQDRFFGTGCRIMLAAGPLWLFAAASTAWAAYPLDTLLGLATLALTIVWFLAVRDLISSWRHLRTLAICLVSSGAVCAFLTTKQYFIDGDDRAGAGIAGGINGTGAILVSILPFAVVLLERGERRLIRVLAAGTLVTSLVGILVTFSRTSAVLTGMVLLLLALRQMGRRRQPKALLLLVLVVAASASMTWEPAQERLMKLKPGVVSMWDAVASSRANVTARAYHIRVGWTMFMDSPIGGVGYANYPRQFRERYQFQVPGSDRFYGSLRSPHSSYTGMLAETGVIGLLIWLICLGLALGTALRAWRAASKTERIWVEVIGASLVVQIVYGVSSPIHQEKFLWMLFGLVSATLALAQHRRAPAGALAAAGGAPVGGAPAALLLRIPKLRLIVNVPRFARRLFRSTRGN